MISVGDPVRGRPGVANSSAVRAALDRLETMDITVPVWDQAAGAGNNSTYRVSAFAQVRLTNYQLPGRNSISARFLGYQTCTSGTLDVSLPVIGGDPLLQPAAVVGDTDADQGSEYASPWKPLVDMLNTWNELSPSGALENSGAKLLSPLSVPGDQNWDSGFAGTSGMNRDILAVSLTSSGVYIGGSFTTAGGLSANRVVQLTSKGLSALGSGLDGCPTGLICDPTVLALATSGSNLYVGGIFGTAGGVAANSIAKWDGTRWTALGSGVSGGTFTTVNALAVGTNGVVYAGGDFTSAGGVAVNNIAKWDGTRWSALGSGVDGTVTGLTMVGSSLYATGYFTTAGSVSANHLAKWDGTSWSALGSGVNDVVNAMVGSGSTLYIAGAFSQVGGIAANNVAKWDGTRWSALGSGVDGYVNGLALTSNALYVGGAFTTAGGISVSNIAKWDGTTWTALGSGVGVPGATPIDMMLVTNNSLYVGGSFTTAGGKPSNHIGLWHIP